jgi:hypothetical protein
MERGSQFRLPFRTWVAQVRLLLLLFIVRHGAASSSD